MEGESIAEKYERLLIVDPWRAGCALVIAGAAVGALVAWLVLR